MLKGEAVVRTIGADRIAVLVDTDGDSSVDQGFLLSTDLPVSSTTVRVPGVTVQYTDGYVRVTAESKVFDLYVAGYPEPPALQDQKNVMKVVGYALQHSSGTSGCNPSSAGCCGHRASAS